MTPDMAIEELVAVGGDDELVPLAEFVGGGDGGGGRGAGEFFDGGLLLLAVFFLGVGDHGGFADTDFFAGDHEDAATFLFVEHAGGFKRGVDIGLIAADDEGGGVDQLAAVLDAGVGAVIGVLRGEAEGEAELEVGGLGAGVDEERIRFDAFFGGGDAGERAVADGPDVFVAVPAGEGFAVEDFFEAGGSSGVGGAESGERGERSKGEGGEEAGFFHGKRDRDGETERTMTRARNENENDSGRTDDRER